MRGLLPLAAALALAGSGAHAQSGPPRPTPPPPMCGPGDPRCDVRLTEAFVDALAQRGASATLPWAARVRYRENGVPMMVDDGIWATVTAHGATPLVVGNAAFSRAFWMGEVAEHGQPAFLALSLRFEGPRIASADAVIRRKEGRPPFADPAAIDFAAPFAVPLAPAARSPRVRMTTLALHYFERLPQPDAVRRTAPDCVRVENGVTDAGGCTGPIGAGGIEAVRGLTVAAVDEARGIVAITGTRDYPGTVAPGAPPPDAPFPHSIAFAAALRIEHGAITRIQEVSTPVPYRMPVADERP